LDEFNHDSSPFDKGAQDASNGGNGSLTQAMNIAEPKLFGTPEI
jgi:hypothetical protein